MKTRYRWFRLLPPSIPCTTQIAEVETMPPAERLNLTCADTGPGALCVAPGDRVRIGQVLARDRFGLPCVSTACGTVLRAEECRGLAGQASVVITVQATDETDTAKDYPSVAAEAEGEPSREGLLEALIRSGIPGLGPVRYGVRPRRLLVSALDEAPLCTVNQRAWRDERDDVLAGLELLRRATDAEDAVLAVPDDGNGATDAARTITVRPVYPNGLPELLARRCDNGQILSLDGRGVAGDTLAVGAEQAAAAARCLREGTPWTAKMLTVSGHGISGTRNVRARIGTPLGLLLAWLGTEPVRGGKLILNGPLRGIACYSPEQPVSAGTDSILVQEPGQLHTFHNAACGNCGACSNVCPVNLEVNMLGRFAEYALFDKCEALGVEACVECGLCGYVCPAHRPIVHWLAHAKNVIRTEALA